MKHHEFDAIHIIHLRFAFYFVLLCFVFRFLFVCLFACLLLLLLILLDLWQWEGFTRPAKHQLTYLLLTYEDNLMQTHLRRSADILE